MDVRRPFGRVPRRPAAPTPRPKPRKIFWPAVSVISEMTEVFVFSYERRRSMTRFVTDLVRGYPPTTLAVFYDGASPEQAARTRRYRRALHPARRDVLWRDLARFPDALSLFGLGRAAAKRGLTVVDRLGRLRVGLDARVALWRELPGYRWRAWLFDLMGVAALLERPMTPRRAEACSARPRAWKFGVPRPHVRTRVSTPLS
jgi:hypothetical protein